MAAKDGKAETSSTMEKIVALCKRRGFIFQSSEIYGGIAGFWDYGPLGTELKRNIKDAWWQDMIRNPPLGPDGQDIQMVGVDCSIIMNPKGKVWEASGHLAGFSDPMVDCRECKGRFREDTVWQVSLVGLKRDQVIKACEVSDTSAKPLPPIDGASHQDRYVNDDGTVSEVYASGERHTVAVFGAIADSPDEAEAQVQTLAKKAKKKNNLAFSFLLAQPVVEYKGTVARSCPKCQATNSLTEPRDFNLMLPTNIGAMQDSSSVAYLRPETAQGIFVNFKNVMDSTRVKIPFGIGQIGKAFRNEINPRNYTFRSREFEQMEIEFFCNPNESMKWYEYWRDVRLKWYESLGIKSDKLRPREQTEDERAHYSQGCIDIEYLFPFSDEPQELEGVAHRGCYDLSAHGKHAKGKEEAFAVIDDETKERFVPHVIEPSAGVDRFALATITEAYTRDENRASPEFMRFHPRLAPVKAAVFPLVAKDGMPEVAEPIFREMKKHYPVQYDAKQSIGKRYARMDEAGTPFCFTIDGQSKEDGTVTVRDRDDASQKRIPKAGCLDYLRDQLGL
jgi:glycyl-tRNA synthetase